MYSYTGVECKQCKKFIALREVTPNSEGAPLSGEYRLSCTDGHQNNYSAGEFYNLESSVPYTLQPPAAPREKQSYELLFIALLLVLLMLVGWLVVSVFFK
jgi:hypothetical protein